jgi:hypothetical protein
MTTDKSDAAPQWGPKMSALPNDRWRAFVVALYDDDAPLGGKGSGRRGSPGLLNWAVDQAGFKCKDQKTRSVTAQRLATDPRTVAACAEYGQAKLRVGLSPMAYQAVKNMLGNPRARHHDKAIAAVLNRSDPIETTHNLRVEQTYVPPTPEMTAAVLERIAELARQAGLPQLPAPVVEDAEFSEVKPAEDA